MGGGTTQVATSPLAHVPLFARVDLGTLAALERRAVTRHVDAGMWLFRQGDEADTLFVVLSGRLRVVVDVDGQQRVARELGPGAALGELALLTGSVRSAGALAVRDCVLLEVGADPFRALLAADPAFGRALAVELARQLQASGGLETRAARPRVLSILPGGRDVDVTRFAATLADELERVGHVVALRGEEPPGSWAPALAAAESAGGHVLLIGGGENEWTRFVRRQGDRLLLVVGTETPVAAVGGVSDLVLLGPLPTGRTAAWLDAVGPTAHHLVYEAGFEIGVARVARRVTGRSLGLVLSGGGARGFAHIGAVAALAEAGFEIDRLGGCSMGAFIAGMAALGLDADRIKEQCNAELVRRDPFNDWTIPRVALLRSRKGHRMMDRIFGELQVEELPRPLFTVSADLLASRVVVHRRGSLHDAISASMSIPGLVPPLRREGRLLVDGGVLNNLPVDLMHDPQEGPIVAVDVVRRLEIAAGESPPLPSIMETMARATLLGSVERAEQNRRLATLVICPEVQDIGLRQFSALDRAVAAGYEAASRALADGGAEILRKVLV